VIVVGIGGVGSWCAEALVRSGIGSITIVDSDTVEASNINRQAEALSSTIGLPKTEALEDRLKDINPACEVNSFFLSFSKETSDLINIPGAAYVIDAIDSLGCKLDLIEASLAAGVTLFSSMGMAQKMDPTQIKTANIWETRGCPLARLVRQGMRKRNITGNFTAVYSPEPAAERAALHGSEATETPENDTRSNGKKQINGSVVTVTAVAGMVLASLVLRDITSQYPVS
jgi:tRNA A37 threonylcarbamoyladenosine dehydratase